MTRRAAGAGSAALPGQVVLMLQGGGALGAGNAPGERLERLQRLWTGVEQRTPIGGAWDWMGLGGLVDVQALAAWGCRITMHVAHPVAPRLDGEDHTKDIDFTAAGIRARREAGRADARRMIERAPWLAPADPIEGIVEHH